MKKAIRVAKGKEKDRMFVSGVILGRNGWVVFRDWHSRPPEANLEIKAC